MIPEVIEKIVDNDLCIGCGICTTVCQSQALSMSWDEDGLLIPILIGECDNKKTCIGVCPFNTKPEVEIKTEDEISALFNDSYTTKDDILGKYVSIYAGYSKAYRSSASSGGIATWLLTVLLKEKIVDSVLVVGEDKKNTNQFCYSKVNNPTELKKFSQTKYYPTTLSEIIREIDKTPEKVAITAIPCFLKALRLKQYKDSGFNEKIVFTIGIFCGGLKSSFFTEYLSSKCGVIKEHIINPQYRIKNKKGSASDYSFGVRTKESGELHTIKMSKVGDMWGTGLFKPNACDFCDDLCAELADVSIGDAWIPPYNNDGAGTNVVISRTNFADTLILKGIELKEIYLHEITKDQAISSQSGNINHRRVGLAYRVYKAHKNSDIIPTKRVKGSMFLNPTFKLVLNQRTKIRQLSFIQWRNTGNYQDFDKLMYKPLKRLRILTMINHLTRKQFVISRIQHLWSRIIIRINSFKL